MSWAETLSWSVGHIKSSYVSTFHNQMSAHVKIKICFEIGWDDILKLIFWIYVGCFSDDVFMESF